MCWQYLRVRIEPLSAEFIVAYDAILVQVERETRVDRQRHLPGRQETSDFLPPGGREGRAGWRAGSDGGGQDQDKKLESQPQKTPVPRGTGLRFLRIYTHARTLTRSPVTMRHSSPLCNEKEPEHGDDRRNVVGW